MDRIDDSKSLLEKQYKTSGNLSSRVNIHKEFSVNLQSWYAWAFSKMEAPEYSRILELGCGDGGMWLENQDQLTPSWNITLTDFSPGMLETVQEGLSALDHPFKFQKVNIEQIPFEGDSFDWVIANHMLYHVPNMALALYEVRRVLADEGHFLAATNGQNHMIELWTLISEFLGYAIQPLTERFKFDLENGAAHLREVYSRVRCERFEDALRVTRAEPLLEYFFSSPRFYEPIEDQKEAFGEFLASKIEKEGAIEISKSVGMFICQK